MGIHIGIFLFLVGLGVGGHRGWIPYGKLTDRRGWRLLLITALMGNILGMGITFAANGKLALSEGAYLERPPYGQGNYEEELEADIAGKGRSSVRIQVPEQEGKEQLEEETVKKLSPQEELTKKIQEAAAQENQRRGDKTKYYLPDSLETREIHWYRPRDASGNLLAALALLAGALLPAIQTRKKAESKKEREAQMFLDYPNVITKLVLLMQAGMTMHRAFSKTALDYCRQRDGPGEKSKQVRHAYEEMLRTHYEMESGVPEAEAYQRFGKRCGQIRYKTLATLLVQNLQKGNKGLLDILEREAQAAFEDRKRKAKILGEEAATKLLFPMILMLLVVLVILVVPACLSFYGG